MPRQPTMRDVARALGLHVTTVSRALQRDRRISKETTEKVTAEARRLGYRPNPLVSALFRYRRLTASPKYRASLAIVSCERERRIWQPINWSGGTFFGAKQAAEDQGYMISFINLYDNDNKLSLGRLASILKTRNVQGLAILPLQQVTAIPSDFAWGEFSVVYLGYPFLGESFSRVTFHIGLGVLEGWQRLRDLGFKRVGMVTHARIEARNNGLREAMWLRIQKDRPVKERIPVCIVDNGSDSKAKVSQWLRAYVPEVILYAYYDSIDLIECQRNALGTKPQIPLVNLVMMGKGKSAGVHQDPVAHGRVGIELLIAMINRNERGVPDIPITTLLDPVWHPGEDEFNGLGKRNVRLNSD